MIKRILYPILTSIILYTLAASCAKQGTPTGGPKDTIPPNLLVSVPNDQTINFKGTDLYFEFDEKINADKLKQQLVITPTSELEYSYTVKKNLLRIKLETPLEDSTTYNFNFSDGVGDITEKNPVINFKLAISTGPYIDSLSISGIISDLFTGKPMKQAVVALYDVSDTTTIFDDKPKYFSTTDETGYYIIENIKNADYRIYSWIDENKSLTYQPKTEAFGFKSDTLKLTENIDSLNIPIQLIDLTPLKMSVAKPFGKYFDIRYSKYIDEYEIRTLSNNKSTPSSNVVRDNEYLRIYNDIKLSLRDSLGLVVTVRDSLDNMVSDTVYAKFIDSKKDPDEFNSSYIPKTKTAIKDKLNLQYSFNKPVKTFNKDSIFINIDTIITLQPVIDTVIWNYNRTKVQLTIPIDWTIINDTIQSQNRQTALLDSIKIADSLSLLPPVDTTSIDSTNIGFNKAPTQLTAGPYKIKPQQFFLDIKKSTFISLERDTLKRSLVEYRQLDLEDLGTINVQINTSIDNYIIQLITSKGENIQVIEETNAKGYYNFKEIPPGKYGFRIILDSDRNSKWSFGNYYENIEPEIAIFPEANTDLKANWEVNLELTF
ncbi:MAG: Ig-like domain-containing protein [bacterium]|nr:Ig-like domain-containing protein [bacterium]